MVHEHSAEEDGGSHDTEPEDIPHVAVVGEVAARLEGVAVDSCTVVAHPDQPGPRADHARRRALAVVARSGLADHLDLPQGRVHWVHTEQMLGQKRPVMRQGGKDIVD